MPSNADVIRDLTRAKAAFQLRTIETVVTGGGWNSNHHAPPAFDVAREDGSVDHHVLPHCRWCKELVSRGLPCTCERAQQEAASIRAGTDR